MLANIIGIIVIVIIFYYVSRVVYKKINPDSDCGSCTTCDQNCPFSGSDYELNIDDKDSKIEKNEQNPDNNT
ncbi:MAG: FeoB-associated Cys-rich membrane protein [Bacillota bacterium]